MTRIATPWVGGWSGGDRGGRGLTSAVGDPVSGGEVLEARESDGVAFLGAGQFRGYRAHEPGQSADPFLDPARVDDGPPVGEGAAQHSGKRQLAAVGGVDRADHLRQSGAFVVDPEPLAGVGDAWRFMPERLEQPGDPVAAGRRAHQHRHDAALAQFARQIIEDEVLRRIDVADQLLHQRVVVVGELLKHEIARLLFLRDDARRHLDDARRRGLAVDEGALEREVDESGGDAVLPDRNLTQQQRGAGSRLEHLQRLAQAPAGLIDLVEKQDARQPELFELAKDDLQRRDLSRIGLANDDGGVADRQGVTHVVDEFDRAGESKKVNRSPR